jgi:tetratricopeptide (TPR) repeat protein
VQRVSELRDLTARQVPPVSGWVAALAATALIVLGGWVLWRAMGFGARQAEPEQVAARWADLEIPQLDLRRPGADGGVVFRDGAAGGELGAAIEAYLEGDFAAAAACLGPWSEAHPENIQARLLLGAALLNAGDVEGAVIPLEEVASLEAADATADARYFLALAYLKRGEEDKARAQLQLIEAGGGRWKAEAERLLPKLAEAGGGAR